MNVKLTFFDGSNHGPFFNVLADVAADYAALREQRRAQRELRWPAFEQGQALGLMGHMCSATFLYPSEDGVHW